MCNLDVRDERASSGTQIKRDNAQSLKQRKKKNGERAKSCNPTNWLHHKKVWVIIHESKKMNHLTDFKVFAIVGAITFYHSRNSSPGPRRGSRIQQMIEKQKKKELKLPENLPTKPTSRPNSAKTSRKNSSEITSGLTLLKLQASK